MWLENHFVDCEHGINAAVRRLRDALNDSADTPQFIETLPKRGYRFIAPIGVEGPPRRHVSRRLVAVLVAVGLLATIPIVRWRRASGTAEISIEDGHRDAAHIRAGLQMNPPISSDGKFVAYASNESGNFNIWVKNCFSARRFVNAYFL